MGIRATRDGALRLLMEWPLRAAILTRTLERGLLNLRFLPIDVTSHYPFRNVIEEIAAPWLAVNPPPDRAGYACGYIFPPSLLMHYPFGICATRGVG